MSNVAKLKKQAAELELKKQFDKALAIYVKLLDSFDQYPDELEVALFNRVGDLMLRQGNVADAVDYYERAVDRYADTGFFNNAIALCNKILRHSPGRASVYYKLGKISAQKGFKTDAKVNFLEYADRMQKSGKVDESFRALKEFADLCPDQDEIRLMLADQLTKADRKPEAIEQLQTLYEHYASNGQATEAQATAARMRAIDPSVEPRAGGASQKATGPELVFLDLDSPPKSASTPPRSFGAPKTPTPPRVAVLAAAARPPEPAADPELDHRLSFGAATPAYPTAGMPGAAIEPLGIERIGDEEIGIDFAPTAAMFGLEATSLASDDLFATEAEGAALFDIEPTSLEPTPIEPTSLEPTPIEPTSLEPTALEPTSVEPTALEPTSLEPTEIEPPRSTPTHRSAAPTHRAIAGGEAEDIDFVLPVTRDRPTDEQRSVEFDLAALTPPMPKAAASAPRPTQPTSYTPAAERAALNGLPLMDLEVPTVRAAPRTTSPIAMPATGFPVEDLDDAIVIPTPSNARAGTIAAAHTVERLRADVEREPQNWDLRRRLAEAMLEAGDRPTAIRELESAMAGAERMGHLDLASAMAEEIARIEPDSVRHHQKRVEYAFRTNDRVRLIEAYLSLAHSLFEADQADKARAVYQRVIDLAPDEMRARAALDAITMPDPAPEIAPPVTTMRGPQADARPAAAPPPTTPGASGDSTFVNLGDWLRDTERPKDTRMVVAEEEPSGNEDADFADMLRKFKQGVAANVDVEDYQSHYDLAIAYKEMGLLDEAIAEFQKALGGEANRLPTYESLGQCFLDKGQPKLAASILTRALNERGTEEQMVGVLYLLGQAAETLGKIDDAMDYYHRVFVLDIQFRDVADRLAELERPSR